jgi:hypothetical protein
MVRLSFPSWDTAGAAVGAGGDVGPAVASGAEVASIAGGEVASAAGGAAGAGVDVAGAAAPHATANNVIDIDSIVKIYLLLQAIRHLENLITSQSILKDVEDCNIPSIRFNFLR